MQRAFALFESFTHSLRHSNIHRLTLTATKKIFNMKVNVNTLTSHIRGGKGPKSCILLDTTHIRTHMICKSAWPFQGSGQELTVQDILDIFKSRMFWIL